MGHTLVVDMLGAPIGIDTGELDEASCQVVREAWIDALLDAEPVTTVTMSEEREFDRALEYLSQQVTLAGIRHHRGTRWMLHAAGLADEQGRVLVFVGPSGRGKTTASIALAREFGYVSDETIGIAPDGAISGYRKPLSIIQGEGQPKAQTAPSSLGLTPPPAAPLTLAGIVVLDRQPEGPATPRVENISLAEAVDELVPQSSSLTALEAPLQYIARILDQTGGLRRLVYREADTLADVVRGMFESPQHPFDYRPLDVATHAPEEPPRPPLDETQRRYWRAPAVDAISTIDPPALLVLQEGRTEGAGTARVLAGIAPTLWHAAEGLSFDAIVAAAVSEHGAPPEADAAVLVRSALDELVDGGVLVAV